jgi:hypothetical protein
VTSSAVPVVGSPPTELHGPLPGSSAPKHVLRAAGAGALASAATYLLLASGVVSGPGALVLLVLLLVGTPTAPELGRRLALNGAVTIGWVPVLWWVRWPVQVDHGAVVAAAAVGALVGWVLLGDRPRRRARLLVPRCTPVDTLVLVGGALALACMRRWAFPGSAHAALVALLPGADNYAHFHMFSTLRTYGAVTTALGSEGDRSGWGFDDYPQGFHALAATLSELLAPRWTPGTGALVAYTQVVALVVVLGVVVLTAAVVSLPGLRGRPLLALPVAATTWAAFLWAPGQHLLVDGFANFWLASLAVGCALLLAVSPRRGLAGTDVLAVVGLVVAVAHMWAPLVVIAAPAVPALFGPWRDRGPRSARGSLPVALLVVVLGALGVAKALLALFADIDVGTLVTAFGGIHGSSPLPTFVLVVTAGYVCCCAPALVRRHHGSPEQLLVARRVRFLGSAPLAGLALATLLLVAQLRTVGTSSYYFVKFVMGYELALAAFVPAVVGMLLAWLLPASRKRRFAVVTSLAATVLLAQSFGPVLGRTAPLLDPGQSGTASIVAPYSADRIADGVLAAIRGGAASSLDRDYLAIGPDRAAEAFYPDGWYHGALATLTRTVFVRFGVLRTKVVTVADAVPVARRYLEADQQASLVVDPAYVGPLRRGLDDAALARRVSSWSVQTEGER